MVWRHESSKHKYQLIGQQQKSAFTNLKSYWCNRSSTRMPSTSSIGQSTKMPRRRRTLISFLIFMFLKMIVFYWFLQTDFYLTRMTNPMVQIDNRTGRTKCCQENSHQCPASTPYSFKVDRQADNAFFIETSSANTLTFRQACAVESLARINPNLTVNVLMSGNVDTTATSVRTLLDGYNNTRIIGIQVGDYVAGTELENWYFCTTWNYGSYAISHLSDALRFLTLHEFGGYYFDLDMIQLRPVTRFRNFVVREEAEWFGSAKTGCSVIHADFGHPITGIALQDFYTHYKRRSWAHNGPDLLTRVLKSWCRVNSVTKMNNETCQGFNVLPPHSFYPVHYYDWKDFFKQRYENETPDFIVPSDVIGAHVWNSNSVDYPVRKHSNQFYTQLARSQCPLIFSVAPEVF